MYFSYKLVFVVFGDLLMLEWKWAVISVCNTKSPFYILLLNYTQQMYSDLIFCLLSIMNLNSNLVQPSVDSPRVFRPLQRQKPHRLLLKHVCCTVYVPGSGALPTVNSSSGRRTEELMVFLGVMRIFPII